MSILNSVLISGKEVLPIIEGGKGINVSNGKSSGAFALEGAVGTISGTNADLYDEYSNYIPNVYHSKTRTGRFRELVEYAIQGATNQIKLAHEKSNGQGRLHLNVLWEAGGTKEILKQVLENTKGLIHGVTSGAGLPYDLAPIAEAFKIWYYPIISSKRAFRLLWKRSYSKMNLFLGGVVYEDPWHAGGHNGFTNKENVDVVEEPYLRVVELRKFMNSVGLQELPIVMAGNVWYLREWKDWIDNNEIGKIAFQFGTRPLLCQESTISTEWKKALFNANKDDLKLHKFSPTGFYSTALNNTFLKNLYARSQRQVTYSRVADIKQNLTHSIEVGARKRKIFVNKDDFDKIQSWIRQGYDIPLKTPDNTMIFETKEVALNIKQEQNDCKGCLSNCAFSSWSTYNENYSTSKTPDPRSFCIQNTLQDIGHNGSVDNNLAFSGKSAYKFKDDPLFNQETYPTVKQLVQAILQGN